jgi:hypothetical protein
MIDAPVVKRAEKLIKLAVDMGKLDKNWIESGTRKVESL